MSLESQTSGSSGLLGKARAVTGRFGFPHLLAVTVAFVATTIVLGVAAKATGSGLACDANWPLCNGGLLNLFPENYPSFFEWIHRVVAMVAGFFIVGTAIAAWRDRGVANLVTYALTLGMVLTPIQVVLGRETVKQYELTILNMHFWSAVVIFVLFAGAAVAVWAPSISANGVTLALGLGAVLVPLHVALSPLFVGSYSPVVQSLQYAVTLGLLSVALISIVVGPRLFPDRRVHGVFAATGLLTFGTMLFGREAVMSFAATFDLLYLGAAAALVVTLLLGVFVTRRLPRSSASPLAR